VFVFNQLDDVEQCALRAGNIHSADGWRVVLEPVIAGYRDTVKRRQPPDLRAPRSPAHGLCNPAAGQRHLARAGSDTCSSARLGDDQRGQGRDQVDAAVMPDLSRQRRTLSSFMCWPKILGISCGRRRCRRRPWLNDFRADLDQLLTRAGHRPALRRYVTSQMAEVTVSRQMFPDILSRSSGWGTARTGMRRSCEQMLSR
jgi:hypothetical protein